MAETPTDNIACASLSTVNLRNSRINHLKFVDGKACESDGLPGKCDWEHKINQDQLLYPTAHKQIRLIVITANHLTGSGSWDTVFMFDCLAGSLKKIFEKRYLYGVKIEKSKDGTLIFTSGVWKENDPMCCPSERKYETYRWSPDKNTYVLSSTASAEKN